MANRQLQCRQIAPSQFLPAQLETTGLLVIDRDQRTRLRARLLEANDREGRILPTLEAGRLQRMVLGNLQQRLFLTLAVGAQGLPSRRPAHLQHRFTSQGNDLRVLAATGNRGFLQNLSSLNLGQAHKPERPNQKNQKPPQKASPKRHQLRHERAALQHEKSRSSSHHSLLNGHEKAPLKRGLRAKQSSRNHLTYLRPR